MYIQVALDVPMFTALTYRVPPEIAGRVQPGQLVRAPLGSRALMALVMEVDIPVEKLEVPPHKIRPIQDIVEPEPLLTAAGIEFLRFVADYYFAPIGEVARMALPAAMRLEGITYYALAPEVCAHALPEDLAPALREALGLLANGEELSLGALREKIRGVRLIDLKELEYRELVRVTYRDDRTGPKAMAETWYQRATPPETLLAPAKPLGKKQQEILGLLAGGEPMALSALRLVIDGPHASLRTLLERGLVTSWQEEVFRDPFATETVEPAQPVELTPDQQRAVHAVAEAREAGRFEGFLLHGVTGSGKTQVYVELIRQTLAAGQRALVLLPEIALTPQFVNVFRRHFAESIAVLHSGLTAGEKFDQWRRIKRQQTPIVIGARSALFAPLQDIGIIIVDEEHDPSFKQEEGPRYNARDMAMVRGRIEGARVVLGSATPSLETWHNASQGRLTVLSMPRRVAERPLPGVRLVDLRKSPRIAGQGAAVLSRELCEALQETLTQGMQGILFLNRRGYSPCVLCESCGYLFQCPNCDVSLTYHRHQEALRCHHCDHGLRMPESCPGCQEPGLGRRGTGTEKLEEDLGHVFPRARIARLDRDNSNARKLHQILQQFREGKLDLLVGTQMVTKGHDFPKVTCVGVVQADMSLNFPDFRAAERTFQLLTQVAGRAGRAEHAGQVFVQSFQPEHYSLQTASAHDFAAFAARELAVREELGYPPHAHLVALKFEAASDGAVVQATRDFTTAARLCLRRQPEWAASVVMLGPALAPLARLKGKSRWQILFKSRSRPHLRKFMQAMLAELHYFDKAGDTHPGVRVVLDVDPLNLL